MFENYSEIKIGERQEVVITKINEGTQADFRKQEYLDKFEDSEGWKQPCIEVVCENGSKTVFALPLDKVIKPKSDIAAFKRTYGKYPEVGMKVTTRLDENGFWKLVLEK